MSPTRNIVTGFALVILILIALGAIAINQVREIGKDADNLYKHPFTVSNAARTIDFHLVSMHRYMKDVVLAQNDDQLLLAIEQVSFHEQEVLKNFDVIFDRFLGERAQIKEAYQAFVDWKPIRTEVIQLSREKRYLDAAEITKGRGADHVRKLNQSVGALVSFAYGKAESFHSNAKQNERNAVIGLWILAIAATLGAISIAFYVTRNLISVNRERQKRQHLVDQHIMMASLDKEGNVVDASNALCRFLGCLKPDLVGRPSHFFDNSDEADETQKTIWNTIQTGKEWKGEIKRYGTDGHIHWASSSIVPTYNENYELVGFTNILMDTTSKKLSLTDKLTHLYNRRRYEEILPREMRVAKRNDQPITLAVADIDFFKKYNDTYGHPKGDETLSRVAETLLKSLKRPNDFAFRIGGEEFAILFSDLGVKESETFLDEMRSKLEAQNIEHGESSVSNHVTISMGAYVMQPHQTLTPEKLYDLADKALYMAKGKRNSVVVNG